LSGGRNTELYNHKYIKRKYSTWVVIKGMEVIVGKDME
jgi:hypothetical protein